MKKVLFIFALIMIMVTANAQISFTVSDHSITGRAFGTYKVGRGTTMDLVLSSLKDPVCQTVESADPGTVQIYEDPLSPSNISKTTLISVILGPDYVMVSATDIPDLEWLHRRSYVDRVKEITADYLIKQLKLWEISIAED